MLRFFFSFEWHLSGRKAYICFFMLTLPGNCNAMLKGKDMDMIFALFIMYCFSQNETYWWDIIHLHFLQIHHEFFLRKVSVALPIYLVDACSCTCVCTWERVWYFCYPCPKSDSSSGCRSWTRNTQIVTTPNSTIYLSIFAMLIALEKMQIWWILVYAGLYFCFWKQSQCQHSTQGNHWKHVQVTIWWFFCTREWLWVAGAGFIYTSSNW